MNNLISIIAVAILLVSCNADPSYNIDGILAGAEGKTVYLERREGGEWIRVDSVVIADKAFHFSGRVGYPSAYYLSIDGGRGYRMFFLENSNIFITGHADTLYNLIVKGSASNNEFEKYSSSLEIIYDNFSELFDQQHMALEAGDLTAAGEIAGERARLNDSIVALQLDFVKNHSSSYVSPFILRSLSPSLDLESFRDMIDLLDPELNRTDIVKSLRTTLAKMENLQPGNMAPDFTQTDVNGIPFTLSENTGNGPMLIEFWASWCSGCRVPDAEMVNICKRYSKKGFRIISVSLDSSKEEWIEAIRDDLPGRIEVSDLKYWNNEVALLYNINKLPSNYLISREGKILASDVDAAMLEMILKKTKWE